MKLILRPKGFNPANPLPHLRPILGIRNYASQHKSGSSSTAPKRKAITPFSDNGFVPWKELSVAEKASRATQQSFNFGLVILGVVMTV